MAATGAPAEERRGDEGNNNGQRNSGGRGVANNQPLSGYYGTQAPSTLKAVLGEGIVRTHEIVRRRRKLTRNRHVAEFDPPTRCPSARKGF